MTFAAKSYSRGSSSKIIVGAAAIFVKDTTSATETLLPAIPTGGETYTYKDTLTQTGSEFTSVGYTTNGLELTFQPDFGEVKVDQVLDVAKLYKQGMKVELKTTFAEATLENLLVAIASNQTTGVPTETGLTTDDQILLTAGELGEYPIERSLIAVGPSVQPADADHATERIYLANRVLSIQNVTVSAKRDAASEFEVTFRLLPNDNGVYGKIVDRTYSLPA